MFIRLQTFTCSLFLLAPLAALVLGAGCGGGSSPTVTPTATATLAPSPTTTPSVNATPTPRATTTPTPRATSTPRPTPTVTPTPRPTATPTATPRPSGQLINAIVFVAGSGNVSHIFRIDANGANRFQLTTENSIDPAASPDGRAIVYSTGTQLMEMSADGSGKRALTTAQKNVYLPVWTRDGKRIVFSINFHPFIIAKDGSGLRRLASFNVNRPTLSPDGREAWYGEGTPNIVKIPLDGGVVRRDALPGFSTINYLDVSPNGRRLTFLGRRATPTASAPEGGLYTCDLDGSNLHFLGGNSGDDPLPRWNPSSDRVVHVVSNFPNGGSLFISRYDGSNRRFLTSGSLPDWR